MQEHVKRERTLGLFDATGVGVGAIVGGGILALAGVAFAITGPGAMVAFALNGMIAIITALSFAEMAVAFPQSGGTYNYAKKVLSVQTAFAVGWIVWFASIVAAVLYALGFASFFVALIKFLFESSLSETSIGHIQFLLDSQWFAVVSAIFATLFFSVGLLRKNAGGGQMINVGKVIVFAVLIVGGAFVLRRTPLENVTEHLTPFFTNGFSGLVQAMGYTFIALQGFDLIAAVAGEVKNPEKNLPRSMLLSLFIALLIYIPLLFIVSTIGVEEGQNISALSEHYQETVIVVAARNYLGEFGYWLVMVAALLSMLSALQANLFAASRISLTMARDRTLPYQLDKISEKYGTPKRSIIVTGVLIIIIIIAIPNVAAAGAASSLIFLMTFALAHGICIIIRKRGTGTKLAFRVPFFPLIPVVGIVACAGLALFQGIMVPSAGVIAAVWLVFGGILYVILFAHRARVLDASIEAQDPQLLKLRGRSPLVLVPIANPANARSMVAVAHAMSPLHIGRVLLLQVVHPPDEWKVDTVPQELVDAQAVLRESLIASFSDGMEPQALTTIAQRPWQEIKRVATIYRCESLLIGFTKISENVMVQDLENLISDVDCDVVVLRSAPNWSLKNTKRILVPIGGLGKHDELRARLLASIYRTYGPDLEITFFQILPENVSKKKYGETVRELSLIAQDEVPGKSRVQVVKSNEVEKVLMENACLSDLLILGLQRVSKNRKTFGPLTIKLAQKTECPIIMISRKG